VAASSTRVDDLERWVDKGLPNVDFRTRATDTVLPPKRTAR